MNRELIEKIERRIKEILIIKIIINSKKAENFKFLWQTEVSYKPIHPHSKVDSCQLCLPHKLN
jgi:hypothetical protein